MEHLETAVNLAKSIYPGMYRCRLAALLIDGRKVIAAACNSEFKHAEINCINNFDIRKKHKKYTLLIIRILSNNQLTNAKPCNHCLNILKKRKQHLRIKKIIYSTWNGELIEESMDTINNDHITIGNRRRFRR